MNKIKKELISYYDGLPWFQKMFVKERVKLLPLEKFEVLVPPAGKIIDLGCGHGIVANYLALTSADRQVVGIDFDEARINWANSTVRNRSNVRFICGDINDIEVGAADTVILFGVLCLVPFKYWDELFEKVFQSLKNEGIFLLHDIEKGTDLKYFFHELKEHIFRWIKLTKAEGFYVKREEDLIRQVQRHGFSVEKFMLDVKLHSTLNIKFTKKP